LACSLGNLKLFSSRVSAWFREMDMTWWLEQADPLGKTLIAN
jgi:hypothetical protein